MRDPGSTDLDDECRVFSRYLIGALPGDYILAKYRDAHARLPALGGGAPARFDALLLALSARRPILARLVDSYARVFIRHSRVRVKLVVLLAILECSPPTSPHFDGPDTTSLTMLALRTLRDGLA
ncbi:MAG: hypothetical protein ACRELA_16100, partial [Candidatus Rokuibacteriota bacterium]